MRDNQALLAQIMGYMDSGDERTRAVAFEKARGMLAASGTSFAAMHEAAARMAAIDEASGTNASATPDADAPIGRYVQPKVAGRFARRHQGKPILRGVHPPNGVPGRLRILADVREYPDLLIDVRRLTLSFETADHLYEPFKRSSSDPAWLAAMRVASATGSPLMFSPHPG